MGGYAKPLPYSPEQLEVARELIKNHQYFRLIYIEKMYLKRKGIKITKANHNYAVGKFAKEMWGCMVQLEKEGLVINANNAKSYYLILYKSLVWEDKWKK